MEFYGHQWLRHYGYEIKRLDDAGGGYAYNFKIDGRNVTINMWNKWSYAYDVCLLGCFVDSDKDRIDMVKQYAVACKQRSLTSPVLMVGNVTSKCLPKRVKNAELAGRKMVNRKIGDKLAQELGAIKYIEYSWRNGRGHKILLDEITFAHFSKLEDIIEQQDHANDKQKQIN